jgi:hypothetical protein
MRSIHISCCYLNGKTIGGAVFDGFPRDKSTNPFTIEQVQSVVDDLKKQVGNKVVKCFDVSCRSSNYGGPSKHTKINFTSWESVERGIETFIAIVK